jgi:sec-independent protein translocase protein TatC
MPDLVAEPEKSQVEKELRQMGSMSLMEHLEELRKRILRSVFAVAICIGAGWYWVEPIIGKMVAPIQKALAAHHFDTTLIYLNPTDTFNIQLKIGLIVGIFISCPFLLYQVWGFISPGLYRNEKKFLLPFLFLSVGLFVSGGYFGYRVVFPVAMDFLIGQGGPNLKPAISITEYTDLFLTIILGLALVFELPIILGFLGAMGVVSAKFLFKHIRGAVLIFFVIAAILTPTTDIMNMSIYAAPMVLLYIGSIGIVWLVHPRQRRKRADKRKQKDIDSGRSL